MLPTPKPEAPLSLSLR